MPGAQLMPDATRVTMFETDTDDKRIVMVGANQIERYGARGSELAMSNPCYDERAFDPIEGDPDLMGLMGAIEEFGYLKSHPIDVWKDGEFFLLRGGGRGRYRVCCKVAEKLGRPVSFTVMVAKGTEAEAYTAKVLDNAHRRQWKPIEHALLIVEGRDKWKLTPRQMVKLFGSQEVIDRRLKLLNLAQPLRDQTNVGAIPIRVAEQLADWPRGEQEAKLIELREHGFESQEDQREALRQMSKPAPDGGKVTARDVVVVQPRPVLRKLADRILDGTLKVPGIERMKVPGVESKLGPEHYFALGMRMAVGQINPRSVAGLIGALREVSPKRREKQLAAQDGDAEADEEQAGAEDGAEDDD